ncbi:LOW QUALITY PROTEIN: hypothetical protein MAR_030712 [Mya arenaria]|uniref:SWIM-type domain-containing protein n=1 Tax=Mya arenaria TaxID=6604 RepID=A0ABY7F5Z8_MYAAR|nr:LOW QUALITY PROTEIN: hypothetical protein MAR_030712 [Mya arenaria]
MGFWYFNSSHRQKHVVKAKVLQSQRLREKPLNPWIIAEGNGKVLSSHCDCMAGLGESCTHVAALLFAVGGTVQIRNSRTVTQEPAYWLLPTSLKGVTYNEVRNIDFSAAKTLKKRFNTDCDNLQQTVATKYPKLLINLREKDPISLNFAELLKRCNDINIEVSKEEEVSNVEKATKNNPRRIFGRIKASKMKNACHTDPSNPSQSLIMEICYSQRNKFSNLATRWGLSKEKVALSTLLNILIGAHENSLKTVICVFQLISPHVAASPDGINTCDCCGRSCVEVKCPYSLRDKHTEECDYLVRCEDGHLRLETQNISTTTRYRHKWELQKLKCVISWFRQRTCVQRLHKVAILPEMVVTKLSLDKIVWFHFTCLKLTNKPKAKKWYCPDCRRLPEFSKKETSCLSFTIIKQTPQLCIMFMTVIFIY